MDVFSPLKKKMQAKFIKQLIFLLCCSFSVWGYSAEKESKPNILFISMDDLNDWVACFGGHPDVKTPNIDRLAARGVIFTQNYCPAPLCNSSRVALLTGMRPSTSGVYHNSQPWKPIFPNTPTMMHHFKTNGYLVFGGGKIFHGHDNIANGFQDPSAWDFYYVRSPQVPENAAKMAPKQKVAGMPYGPVDLKDEEMGDGKVAAWAAEELQKKRDKPFFMAVGFGKPHLAWTVPQKYFDMYPPDKVTLPKINDHDLDDVPPAGVKMAKPETHKTVLEKGAYAPLVAAYLASISFADACVGKVLDGLDRSPYAENTIIVLWGDHGWHLGEKQHWKKFTLWEEGTRCPMIFVVPKVTPKEARCSRMTNLMDMYPTLAELCGLPAPKCEATSIVPLLKKPDAAWDKPAVTTYGKNNHTVRTEKWRYIRYADGGEELYDHEKDPLEWTNLAGKAEFESVKKDLQKFLPTVNADDVPEDPNEVD
jgi:arylsulfatase A-like enzyme